MAVVGKARDRGDTCAGCVFDLHGAGTNDFKKFPRVWCHDHQSGPYPDVAIVGGRHLERTTATNGGRQFVFCASRSFAEHGALGAVCGGTKCSLKRSNACGAGHGDRHWAVFVGAMALHSVPLRRAPNRTVNGYGDRRAHRPGGRCAAVAAVLLVTVGLVGCCTEFDRCTFGNCEFKETVLQHVASSASNIDCGHRHVKFTGNIEITAATDARTRVAFKAVALQCQNLSSTPTQCDTQYTQDVLEWVLIFVTQVFTAIRVCQCHFSGIDGARKKTN